MRYTGPRNRIARRYGVNIFCRVRNPLIHKANPPGMHGARRRKKSDYGVQFEEKQKLKAVYGMITERQLLRYFREAVRKTGNTAHLLMQRLECRLDSIVYRLRFGSTMFHAHQLVAHGHVLVDGKKVDIRSFELKPGMVVSIKEKSHNNKGIRESVANSSSVIPEYLSRDERRFFGELLSVPHVDQIPLPIPINFALVCEFMAHVH